MSNDNRLQFKKRMTKASFEARLYEDFNYLSLSCRPHVEGGSKMTLYYNDGTHCGTWHKGVGWTFKDAYECAVHAIDV